MISGLYNFISLEAFAFGEGDGRAGNPRALDYELLGRPYWGGVRGLVVSGQWNDASLNWPGARRGWAANWNGIGGKWGGLWRGERRVERSWNPGVQETVNS